MFSSELNLLETILRDCSCSGLVKLKAISGFKNFKLSKNGLFRGKRSWRSVATVVRNSRQDFRIEF
jgi:hypothetical protein